MESITIVMFIVVFALTIIFSILAWDYKSEIWSFLSMAFWFSLGLLNMGLMFGVEPMFYAFSLLYYGVGMLFFCFGVGFLFNRFQQITRRKREREMELE